MASLILKDTKTAVNSAKIWTNPYVLVALLFQPTWLKVFIPSNGIGSSTLEMLLTQHVGKPELPDQVDQADQVDQVDQVDQAALADQAVQVDQAALVDQAVQAVQPVQVVQLAQVVQAAQAVRAALEQVDLPLEALFPTKKL